jgi:hypothetical protein
MFPMDIIFSKRVDNIELLEEIAYLPPELSKKSDIMV